MVLGVSELAKLVQDIKLVDGLSERELTNPEGAGYDLRVGEIYGLSDQQGYLGIDERNTPDLNLLCNKIGQEFFIVPNKYYVVMTVEALNLPKDISAIFRPRSTLFRSGVTIFTGTASPGYSGKLGFGLINMGHKDFRLEVGSRIAHAMFLKVEGEANLYRGQWQGGRTHTPKKETQV